MLKGAAAKSNIFSGAINSSLHVKQDDKDKDDEEEDEVKEEKIEKNNADELQDFNRMKLHKMSQNNKIFLFEDRKQKKYKIYSLEKEDNN